MGALDASLETALRRDRLVVALALVLVAGLAWAWLLAGAGMDTGDAAMPGMGHDAMAEAPWSAAFAALMLAMWWIMMLAMMLPSASPMILLFAAINRKQRERGGACTSTAAFATGYVMVWGGFSAVAVALQWAFEHAGLFPGPMAGAEGTLGGPLLIAAGLYQLTPLKHACLARCRSPAHFLSEHWRGGTGGAVRMGVTHGAFCVGCCWFLMLLLFVGGLMNLAWVAGLAVLVLLEKTVPAGHWLARGSGVILVSVGVWQLLGA
jgi:predicted metal-binding membrane protein